MQETQIWSLGQGDPLEEEMAIHSNILAWKIPWTEEPNRLQFKWLQRVSCICLHIQLITYAYDRAFFFNFTILYWFCHIPTWIGHRYTHVRILNPPPSSFPVPSLWVIPVHQPQASSIVHWTWTGDSFHIWYYTCFSAILPNHPTLSLSHRVQKTVLYICVSFAVSYTGLLLPSF